MSILYFLSKFELPVVLNFLVFIPLAFLSKMYWGCLNHHLANINISQNNFDGKILIQVLVIHGLVTLNERFNQKNLKYLGLTWQKNQLWPYPFDILFCSSLSKLSCYNKGYGCDFNEKLQFAYKEQYFAS